MSGDRVDPALLWARALAVGSVAVLLGVLGHVTSGGLLPGPGVLAGILVLAVVLSAPALDRPATSLRLVTMLVGGQAAIHVALSATAGHVGDPSGPARATATTSLGGELPVVDGRRTGSLLEAYQVGAVDPLTTGSSPTVDHLVAGLVGHAPMMLAHLLAAAVVGLWLARGERCLWALLALTSRLVLARVPSLVPAPVATRPTPALATTAVVHVGRDQWRVCPLQRRGPPLVA